MNPDQAHVSELLVSFLRDELDASRAASVRAHLDDCPDCRAELAGVRALATLPAERLEPAERVALRDAVRAGARRRWAARLAPALGAVGLVVVTVVAAATLLTDTPVRSPMTSSAPVEDAGDTQGRDGPEGAAARPDSLEPAAGPAAESADAGAAAGGTTDTGAGAASAPQKAALDELEGSVASPVTFARAAPLGPGLLDVRRNAAVENRTARDFYFDSAPTRGWARQIARCTETTLGFLPAGARLSFAQVYEADDLLVMGFVWLGGDGQRYAFWGWPEGDCTSVTPIHTSGAL